jgi:hypothetical protein
MDYFLNNLYDINIYLKYKFKKIINLNEIKTLFYI